MPQAAGQGVVAERDAALLKLKRERQMTAFYKKVLRSKRVDVDALEDALCARLEEVCCVASPASRTQLLHSAPLVVAVLACTLFAWCRGVKSRAIE